LIDLTIDVDKANCEDILKLVLNPLKNVLT